jgi:nucleoid DNA-binding protein
MNKSNLISVVAAKTGSTEAVAQRIVETLLALWEQELATAQSVEISGLGTLKVAQPTSRRTTVARRAAQPTVAQRPKINFYPSEALTPSTSSSDATAPSSHHISCGGIMSSEEHDNVMNEQEKEASCFGLDVGTSRIVLANGELQNIKTATQLNAFVTVPYSKFTENILKQNKISYQLNGREILVFGNESEKFANSFNVEARRPMYNGLLNPNEAHGWAVIQAIIQMLVKKSENQAAMLCFSVPGAPRGGEANLVYHEGMLRNFLDSLGYKSKSVNEGLSVVFSELEKDNFTGIGISCGGGMCNVCFAFMSVPVFSFSISKAGDYIDNSVAAVTSEVATRIRVVKEESLDLSRPPRDKYENAMHIYYEEVILTLVEALRTEISEARNMPKLDRPIPIVLSGGTAKPKGFLQKFDKMFRQIDFPIKVSEVRVSEDPLTATARGCYIAALYES